MVMVTVQYMWIDDTSADVIKVDFEALYHGDVLVEGDTSEQLDDDHTLPTAVGVTARLPAARPCMAVCPARALSRYLLF
jgi:hypothetical protein